MSHILTRSVAKRRRLEEDQTVAVAAAHPRAEEEIGRSHISSLPDEILFRAFAYSACRDIAILCRVCSRFGNVILGHDNDSSSADFWKQQAIALFGSVLEEVWLSLRGHVVYNQNKPLTDAALWRCIFASSIYVRKDALLEEDNDYFNVAKHLKPAFELEESPSWLMPLIEYSFVVSVWDTAGQESSQTVNMAQFNDSSILLSLGKASSVANVIRSGEVHALQVNCRYKNGEYAVLYSSFSPLDFYGGGSFDEYSAIPWFTIELADAPRGVIPTDWLPNRYDWLPFLSPPVLRESFMDTVMDIDMQWCSKSSPGQRGFRGDRYEPVQGMNMREILTFLNHRCNKHSKSVCVHDEPHCSIRAVEGTLPTQEYDPKPLSSYSFIVEMQKASKECSIFYDCLSEVVEGSILEFEIPTRHQHILPWREDYVSDDTSGTLDIVTLFRVFVIDRDTGGQAKLYESERACYLFNVFELSSYVAFEKCAALTQFSNGSRVETIPVPSTRGFLENTQKRNEETEGRGMPSFLLNFEYLYYASQEMPRASLHFDDFDVLTFLEKGLVYR